VPAPQSISSGFVLSGVKILSLPCQVYHPYRPLRGFLAATANTFPPESREKLQKKASKAVREMVRTDAAFVFSPSELALYALKMAAEDMGVNFAAILDKLVADAASR
jgi:hypothetical protein